MESTNTESQNQNPPSSRADAADNGSGDDGEKVSYSQFKSVKDDMHRFKEEARKKDEELKSLRDKDLKDKEQWKEYGAAKEKEATDWKSKFETLSESIRDRHKLSAVREACLKLGLVETAMDDLELIELKDVVVETTSTGRVNVIGAKAAAERIKSIRPHWFSDKRVPNVNPNAPGVQSAQSGKVSYSDLSKLEEEARKSGDYTEYKKAVMAAKNQR